MGSHFGRTPTSRSLASRLFLSHAAVLLVGIVSAAVVATVIGPPLFHRHLIRAGQSSDSADLIPAEKAYANASLISLGIALVAAGLVALLVSWYVTRKVRQPLASLTIAARELKRGHYDAQVPLTGAGAELDELAEAFNSMATRLEQTEVTRRRLLADLAHEMRTPIATLMTYHDALRDGVAQIDSAFEVISSQTDRLARLATDIADVSVAEEGQLSLHRHEVSMADLINASSNAVREKFSAKNVGLLVDTTKMSSQSVDVDRQRIEQVFSNLLANALRHTNPGGRVMVVASCREGEIEVTVRDDGDGMTSDQLLHAFERFYRGDTARDRDRSGSGVGLTLSKAIADLHGGSLTAASDGPGLGAQFTLTLPIADAAANNSAESTGSGGFRASASEAR